MTLVKERETAIFTADACVIEAQKDHLVVALRVPRDAIDRNIHFIAAVADHETLIASEARPLSYRLGAYASHPNRRKIAVASFLWLLALCGGFAWMAKPILATPDPPLVNVRVWMASPVVQSGQPLLVTFESQRKRLCRTDVERTILDSAGHTVFTFRQSGIGQALSDKPVVRQVQIKLPDGLKPGNYTYRAIMYSDCGPGDQHALQSGDLPFELRGSAQ